MYGTMFCKWLQIGGCYSKNVINCNFNGIELKK